MKSLKESIENELLRVLPASVDRSWIEWIADGKIFIDKTTSYDQFCEPARDLVFRGGKRWRPRLMLLIAKMMGGDDAFAAAEKLVSVVEFPHNGSLIIDDIEDSSEWRRGYPAVHLTHGVDLSINAGNFLYYLPTKAIDEAPVTDQIKLLIYQIYAKYLRRVHLGQGLDIIWHRNSKVIPDPAEYEQMCRLKTGCLAGMSAEIGAAVAVSEMKLIERVGRLAENIGVGFQIQDDVINLEKGNPGKKRGDDIVENKTSLPVILYANEFPECRAELFSVFSLARKRGYQGASDAIRVLIEHMMDSGVIDRAKLRASDILGGAVGEIEDLFLPSEERDMVVSMVKGFLNA